MHGLIAVSCSPPERIEFREDEVRIAVPFGGRHGAKHTVLGAKYDDANHETPREAPGVGLGGFQGVGHLRLLSRRRGPSPLDRLPKCRTHGRDHRSEEHTSELQSLMRISYAVFGLKKKNK